MHLLPVASCSTFLFLLHTLHFYLILLRLLLSFSFSCALFSFFNVASSFCSLLLCISLRVIFPLYSLTPYPVFCLLLFSLSFVLASIFSLSLSYFLFPLATYSLLVPPSFSPFTSFLLPVIVLPYPLAASSVLCLVWFPRFSWFCSTLIQLFVLLYSLFFIYYFPLTLLLRLLSSFLFNFLYSSFCPHLLSLPFSFYLSTCYLLSTFTLLFPLHNLLFSAP